MESDREWRGGALQTTGRIAPSQGEQAWFEEWFGEEYVSLYPHRDRDEARAAVELLLSWVTPPPRVPVLDLACGAGRHLAELIGHGLPAMGLDLSETLLARTAGALPGVPLVRGDMRGLPYRDDSFSVVTSFFTSFGYFDEERDDRGVVREIHRVLRAQGYLLLDFLHAAAVREDVSAQDDGDARDSPIHQERRLVDGGRRVEKRIRIRQEDGSHRTFTERVRLYEPDELAGLLRSAGIAPIHRFGDYDGSPLRDGSPRCILIGRKS